MEWSYELTLEFLLLYEREEAIWKSTSPQHKNKNEVHDAWLRIKKEMKDGTISITDLKKKKENLMSTYRKLKTRVKDSMRTGSGADDIYRPEWPFYSTMANFLDDVYKPRNTKTTVVVSDDSEEESNEASIQTTQNVESSEEEAAFKTPKTIPKKKKKIDETEDRMDEAYKYLKQLNQKPQKDVSAMYCDLLAEKLRNLKEHTREIAMLEMDKLIYNLKQQEKRQQPTTTDYEAQMTQVLHQPPSPWHQSQLTSGYHQYSQLQPLSTRQPSTTHHSLYMQPPIPQNQLHMQQSQRRVLSSQGATCIQPPSALSPGYHSHYQLIPNQSPSVQLSQSSPNQPSSSPSPSTILPDLSISEYYSL